MRSSVYRNLDKPFEIYGFSPMELTMMSLVFVVSGEVAQSIGADRIWAFPFTVIFAGGTYALRRTFGDLFARRLFRFLRLPSETRPELSAARSRKS